MGTSSNFGNMFSAGGASLFLSFLPMLPTQILLNNLLYDIGEMTIPTDNVDEEQLQKPAHWDIRMIRRFMVLFGPISSIFDFATFGIMIWVFRRTRTAVPLRLVRRVAGHAKPRDLCHPHPPRPFLPQSAEQATDDHNARRRGHRRDAPLLPTSVLTH
jgi:magnesium-transporting ATPase (P-type)